MKILVGVARREVAEAMLRCHIAATTAAKRSSEAAEAERQVVILEFAASGNALTEFAASEFASAARGKLEEELAELKTALAEHSEAAEGFDVLREARALRDTIMEESRRAREEVSTHSEGVGFEAPQPHTAAAWAAPDAREGCATALRPAVVAVCGVYTRQARRDPCTLRYLSPHYRLSITQSSAIYHLS